MIRKHCLSVATLVVLVASVSNVQAQQLTPKQQAAANVAKNYALSPNGPLKMTTFSLERVWDNGWTLNVDATCTRTTTYRGVTSTTTHKLRFLVTMSAPPRGQTIGSMNVTKVTYR
jgi:hypothetical protein